MVNRISSLIHQAWSYIPQISKENVSSVAHAALKQLPWVAGTAAGFGLMSAGLRPLSIMVGGGLGMALVFTGYYLFAGLPPEEKTEKLLLIYKTVFVACVVLCLGQTARLYYAAALLFKGALSMSASQALLLQLGYAFQNIYFGNFYLQLGLSQKAKSETIDAQWSGKVLDLTRAINEKRFNRICAALAGMKLSSLIPPAQFIKKNNHFDLLFYLDDHPGEIDQAVALFPVIFDPASSYAQWKGHVDFKKLLAGLGHKEIRTYLDQKYRSPQIEMPNESDAKSIQQFLNKFEQLRTLLNPIRSIKIEGASNAERNFVQQRDKLIEEYYKLLPHLDRLKKLHAQLVQQKVGQALDDLGFTVEDYASRFSSRKHIIQKLGERCIYSLEDLKGENIVGDIEKKEIITRIKSFLAGKDLKPLPPSKPATDWKVARIATAFFNIGLTGGALAVQFALAPLLTSLGVAYGFAKGEEAFNPLRYCRLPQTSLFFPSSFTEKCDEIANRLFNLLPVIKETPLRPVYAFFGGVNQGETLRDYFTQACGG